jgi:hypothetical protein
MPNNQAMICRSYRTRICRVWLTNNLFKSCFNIVRKLCVRERKIYLLYFIEILFTDVSMSKIAKILSPKNLFKKIKVSSLIFSK